MKRFVLLLLALALAPAALAVESRVLRSDGTPLRDAQVSIVGRSGSSRTDAAGRFSIAGPLQPPLTVIVIGPRGEIYEPIQVTGNLPSELRVQAAISETLTVTSGVAPNIAAPPGAATAVVGREELKQRTPEHVVDALERTPGITRRGEGPSAVPVVRGLAGGRTLVLHDDSRITAERRAGPSATFLDPFTLGSIELARGPGSVMYGSDAFGGVIHLRPRDPAVGENGLRYHASLSGGASDFRSAALEVTHDALGGAFLASVNGRQAREARAGGGVVIPSSAYGDRGLSLRFARPGERQNWRVGLFLARAKDVQAPAADANVTRTFYPEDKSTRLTFAWDGAPKNDLAVELRGALGRNSITTSRERLPVPGVARQISSSAVAADDASLRLTGSGNNVLGKWQAGVDLVSRFDLTAEGSIERFDAAGASTAIERESSIGNARKIDSGAFVTLDRELAPRWLASAGIRSDFLAIRNRGGFFGSHARSDQAWSGHVALTSGPWSGVTATVQAASGYRDPTLSDRYFRGVSGRGFVVGNPDLEPERSAQLDASARWTAGRTSLALFGYHYRLRELIERYRSGSDFRFRNRGAAVVRGLELEIFVPLIFGFAVQGNSAIARGEAVDDHQALDDIAAPNAHLALRWSHDRVSAFVHGFWFGEDDRPGPVETARPGYATVDVGVGWRINDAVDLRLQARNLFDRLHAGSADANAALAPGRTIVIALAGRL